METISGMVSVIIPVYNTEKFLYRSLSSITTQTYENLEIIIIDNCSTDSSLSICKEFAQKDPRITIIEKDKTEKVAKSRNIGLERARGEYIAFMDSDDCVVPNYIETLHKALVQHNAQVSMCCYDKYYIDTKEYEKVFPYETVNCYTGRELCKTLCDFKGFASVITVVWGKLYRAHILKGFRFDESHIYEDLMACHKWLYPLSKVVFIPDILYHWSVHRESWSSNLTYRENYTDELIGYIRRIKYFRAKNDRELYLLICKRCYYVAAQHLYKQWKYIKYSQKTQKKIRKLLKWLYYQLKDEPWQKKTRRRILFIHMFPLLFGYMSRDRRLDLSY